MPGPLRSVPASSFERTSQAGGWLPCELSQAKSCVLPQNTPEFTGLFYLQLTSLKNNFMHTKHRGKAECPASSSPIPLSRISSVLMDVAYQDRAPNTTCSQEINCLAVGYLYVVIGMFLHLKLPEGLYKYSAHKYNYSWALARNSYILWDIAVSSPYQSHCKIQ